MLAITKNSIIQKIFDDNNLQISDHLDKALDVLLNNIDNQEFYYLMPAGTGRTYLIISTIYLLAQNKKVVIICDRQEIANQLIKILDNYPEIIKNSCIFVNNGCEFENNQIIIFKENVFNPIENNLDIIKKINPELTIFLDLGNNDIFFEIRKELKSKILYISSQNFSKEINVIPDYKVSINELIKNEYLKNYQQLKSLKETPINLISNNLLSESKQINTMISGHVLLPTSSVIFGTQNSNSLLNFLFKSKKQAQVEKLKEEFDNEIERINSHYKAIIEQLTNSINKEFSEISDVVYNEFSNITIDDELYYLQKNSPLIDEDEINILLQRKKQLILFDKLLSNNDYFNEQTNVEKGAERIWQNFFEKNKWIFGLGLNYVINTSLDNKRLEQVVSGFSFVNSGKRTDALMKTQGIINSLVFAEIKTHKTPLLKQVDKAYRSDCWSCSDELTGGVIQIQKTVQKSVQNIRTKTEITDNNGVLTGEKLFLYQPQSFLIIGSLSEFIDKNGNINEEKFSSFEIFRRNITNPTILTFDELYNRAKHIIMNI